MERVNEILNSTTKRQYLIDLLDQLLKESDFYPEVLRRSRELMESCAGDYRDLCSELSEYVYEHMPEKARSTFEDEVIKFVDGEIHPGL